MEEVDEIIPKVKQAPRSDYLGSYDKENIFEGSKANTSRIRTMRLYEIPISCMSLCMEISLDGDSKDYVDEKSILEEQANQSIKEINKVFYDSHKDNEQK